MMSIETILVILIPISFLLGLSIGMAITVKWFTTKILDEHKDKESVLVIKDRKDKSRHKRMETNEEDPEERRLRKEKSVKKLTQIMV
jgi:hypothetical protein